MAHTILVVDDDALIVELLAHVLNDHGYAVSGCSTRQQALAALQHTIPDLLILDLHLRDARDGLAFIESIRARRATGDLPILVYSTDQHVFEKYAARLTTLDCAVLAKPFALDSLFAVIEHCLAPASERAEPALTRAAGS